MKVADLHHGGITYDTSMSLSEKGYGLIKNNNQIFKKGSIVWSKSGSVGLCSILGKDTTANRGILNILPNDKIEKKYLYYFLIKNRSKFRSLATGAVLKHLYGPNLLDTNIELPNLIIQKNIIEIIKPFENIISNIDNQIVLLKKILIKIYEQHDAGTYLNEVVSLTSSKYNDQIKYLATNSVGEFFVDYEKEQDVTSKRPSRANLTPEDNSIIISKLDGENKLLFIDDNFNHVVSTGFFNIKTDYIDHVIGFLLSKDYKVQKTNYSTGTTMLGINNYSFSKIHLNKPSNKNTYLVKKLNNNLKIRELLNSKKNTIIKLLIK